LEELPVVSVFGQVWLWSLLSFAAGALLAWLVLVRPAKKRVDELERDLADLRAARWEVLAAAPDEHDDWQSESLADEVLEPQPVPVSEPRRVAEPQWNRPPRDEEYLGTLESHDRFEERDDAPFDGRPRSLSERQGPASDEGVRPEPPRAAEATTVFERSGFERSGLEANDLEDEELELPVEQTQYMPVLESQQAAEVESRNEKPSAPAEIAAPVEEVVFRPREVWLEQDDLEQDDPGQDDEGPEPEQAVADGLPELHRAGETGSDAVEAAADAEPAEDRELADREEWRQNPAEETSLIPATVAAGAFAPATETPQAEEDRWPETDLTGEQPVVDDRTEFSRARHAEAPKPPVAPPAVPVAPPAERPRSLFEPVVEVEGGTGDKAAEFPSSPAPFTASDDQPFVPKLAPGLQGPDAGNGLPQRPPRTKPPTAGVRQPPPPPPPPPAPKRPTPPPARPMRPRPVGFSPSTGGRAGGTTRYQQPQGFNPRSPFGPGSVLPRSDGVAPAQDFQVKATLTGRRYFTNQSANFNETRADVWFRTVADAEKAGFRPAP
jgi:hypothetical protein